MPKLVDVTPVPLRDEHVALLGHTGIDAEHEAVVVQVALQHLVVRTLVEIAL
jgi:hypothetical protein